MQLNDGYCLPACAQMVLAYLDIDVDQPKLARQLQTVPQMGTPGSKLVLLTSNILDVTYRSGDLSDLQAAVEVGSPPVALVRTDQLSYWRETAYHAVVVTGFEEETVFVNDPAFEMPDMNVSIEEFMLAWDEMANLYALLRRK